MCLRIDKEKTRNFWLKNYCQKLKCYKVLLYSNNSLCSPYRYKNYMPGIIDSDYQAANQLNIILDNTINNGIHVFLDKETAEKSLKDLNSIYEIVEVIVDCNDLIALGLDDGERDTAVFTRIELSLEEYSKAMESGQKKYEEQRKLLAEYRKKIVPNTGYFFSYEPMYTYI